MKYIVEFLVLILLIYLLSFAKYNWKHNNKIGAIGVSIIGLTAFVFSFIVLFVGDYEI